MIRRGILLLAAAALVAAISAPAAYADALLGIQVAASGIDEQGRIQLYAPNPVEPGSSISHWDIRTSPLLMWPFIDSRVRYLETDLTLPLLKDLGYQEGTFPYTVQYLDPPGYGFNEAEARAPLPTNPGTTLGEQRRIAFEAALAAWSSKVNIPPGVKVLAYFRQTNVCGLLAAASTTCGWNFEPGQGFPEDIVYPQALYEALSGEDATEACSYDWNDDGSEETGDIRVFVPEEIDEGCLDTGGVYYYGLDGNTPTNDFNFVNIVLHELGHGLGFASFVDEEDGSYFFGIPGIYDTFLFDNTADKGWTDMTNAERQDSAINDGHVVWSGPNVGAEAEAWAIAPFIDMSFPPGYDPIPTGTAVFGPPVFGENAVQPSGLGAVTTPQDGCAAISNDLTGKIALIERGTCTFTTKVKNAQNAGAIGAIIYNMANPTPPQTSEDILTMAGYDPTITIPALFVRRSDGLDIRNAIVNGPALACVPSGVNACLLGGRFQVSVAYTTESSAGVGQVMTFGGQRAESDQSAFFYFFDNANFEMGVKMVDACSLNDSFWVFVSGLTNQGYAVTITDIYTGQVRTYLNPLGSYPQTSGNTDGVSGFDCTPGEGVTVEKPTPAQVRSFLATTPIDPLGDSLLGALAPTAENATTACADDSDTACHLGGRFAVEVNWTTVSDTGSAQVMSFGGQRASSDQSSFWWFFDPANFEMGVKMVDACVPPFNAYWVFVSGLTNQGFTVNITDTTTGLSKPYSNPLGTYPQTIGATGAGDGFPCTTP